VAYTVTASDLCDTNVLVSCTPPSGSLFPLGTTTVACTATDDASNQSTCTFTVTIRDTTPPAIVCSSNLVRECTGLSGTPVAYTTTASDLCDSNVLVSCSPPSGSLFPLGTTTVACTATDDATNHSTCTFTVTIRDTTPPVIVCSRHLGLEGTSPSGTPVAYTTTASDLCDSNVTVACYPISGSLFPLGTTEVSCTATDDATNRSTCTFTVTILDTTPPVITCKSNLTLEWVPGSVPVFDLPTASDTGDTNLTLALVDSQLPATCPAVRIFRRTWTATDDSKNSASCSQTITFVDTTPPVIMPANPQTNFQCLAEYQAAPPTIAVAFDNFDGTNVIITATTNSSGGACPAFMDICWTASDRCGNSASICVRIRIWDTIPPEIRCPTNMVVGCDSAIPPGPTSLAAFLAIGGFASDCDTNLQYSCFDGPLIGNQIVRRHTVTDACTNSASCLQIITFGPVPVTVAQTATTVADGWTVTYTATASGAPPFDYQWYRNGVPVAGAIGPSCTTPPIACPADQGVVYSVAVSNLCGSATGTGTALVCGAPLRIVQNPDGSATLSWPGLGWRLQCAPDLTPPIAWQDVTTNGANSYTVSPSNEFNVYLGAVQEVPSLGGRKGQGHGSVSLSNNVLLVDVVYAGLSGTRNNSHFHAPAGRGTNAGVAYNLASIDTGNGATNGTIKGRLPLVNGAYGKTIAGQIQDLQNGLWYLNVHTAPAFGGGEIRGQVEPADTRFYRLIRP